jgi:hypothetical protein
MALSWFSIPFGLMIHKNNPEIYRHCFFTSAGSTCDHSAAELQTKRGLKQKRFFYHYTFSNK